MGALAGRLPGACGALAGRLWGACGVLYAVLGAPMMPHCAPSIYRRPVPFCLSLHVVSWPAASRAMAAHGPGPRPMAPSPWPAAVSSCLFGRSPALVVVVGMSPECSVRPPRAAPRRPSPPRLRPPAAAPCALLTKTQTQRSLPQHKTEKQGETTLFKDFETPSIWLRCSHYGIALKKPIFI